MAVFNDSTKKRFKKKSFSLSKVYGLLEPGPVVMVTTRLGERANVMTMSWQTMLEFEPPLVGCVISNRNHSFDILKATNECVIAIPTLQLAPTVVKVGNTSGKNKNKFSEFGLTMLRASLVSAPLIGECYANLECKVVDTALVNKYNFFILEVCKAWINPAIKHPRMIHHVGKGVFIVDGKVIKFPSKMK